MEIIPSIDLLGGCCVRLYQGDYRRVTRFNGNLVEQALSWQQQGAIRLHIVDLDGARSGRPRNDTYIQAVVKALDIPVQLGGGIRSAKRAKALLKLGLDRVIFGTAAIEQPELIFDLAACHPGRVVVGIDSRDGKVATRGWTNQTDIEATALARQLSFRKIAAIISTDIATDGTLAGPNLNALRAMANASDVPLIASGGVGCMADLLALTSLEHYGVSSVIVGRALYDGRVNLSEAICAISKARLQDATDLNASFA